MKIKNFVKYFKEVGLEAFQNFHDFFKYFKVKYFIAHGANENIHVIEKVRTYCRFIRYAYTIFVHV